MSSDMSYAKNTSSRKMIIDLDNECYKINNKYSVFKVKPNGEG